MPFRHCCHHEKRSGNNNVSTETTEATDKKPLNLSIDVKEESACERHVTVTIPRDDIEGYFNKQFDTLVPRAEVPGFRVGKAPRKIVEKKFRKQVSDQVKGSLLMDSLTQISDDETFSAISEPDLDFQKVEIPDEGDLVYEFNIEVRPEFDIPNWKGLKLERPEYEFTDADLESEIADLGKRYSDLVPVDEAVAIGDHIVCNIKTTYDGEQIAFIEEVGIDVNANLSLADTSIDGFGKLVIGKKADDKVTAKAEINEFGDNEELAGKEVEVEFEILDVKRVEASTAAELAEKLGLEEEMIRSSLKSSMENRLAYAQREQVREQISKTLTESADWELPPDLLRRQSRRELERSVIEMQSSGFSEQDVEINRIAMQQNDSPRRVRAKLERSGQMDSLRNMIIEGKVIAKITEEAEFTATDYSPKDQSDTTALNFFAAGESASIPEAKYAGGEEPAVPGLMTEPPEEADGSMSARCYKFECRVVSLPCGIFCALV
jgi:trigger factor